MYQRFSCLLLPLLFASCLAPIKSFDHSKIAAAPDYSQDKYWAALPTKKDSADALPYGSDIKDEQANAKVDVFFIYPTIYLTGKHWNADVNKKRLNRKIDKSTIRHQASVFNESCKVYAPRYRQAVLWAFAKLEGSGKKSLDLAYDDVKKAFDYYLKNYNNGRPFIIASHSQGSWHAEKLLHDYFDKDSLLRGKLIAAYIIGGPLKKNSYKNIPASDSASQTGCLVCWNTKKWGVKNNSYLGNNLECVNPLTWKRDTVAAPATNNLGSVPYGFKGIDKEYANAKISPTGLLWVHKKPKRGYVNGKNYHVLDYNLFWMNIRENVKLRVEIYLSPSPYPPQGKREK
ncbi:MAG: DUF3089 domain-containing protein [Bacteroidetes bacterium]|nr:DUF3089 domain-containing protein [Bacteroidota bacterium]